MSANTQITALTPNSNCSAAGSGDANNSTIVQFMAPPNGVAWFTTTVSAAVTSSVLGADQGNGVVTFQSGLTVRYAPLSSGGYNVLLSGKITDGSSVYTFTGQVIYMSTAGAAGAAAQSTPTLCRCL